MQTLGGTLKNEDISEYKKEIVSTKRAESFSPQRPAKIGRQLSEDSPRIREKTPKFPVVKENIEGEQGEVKGGIKFFFKGIGGKLKAPELDIGDLSCKKNETSKELNINIKKPDIESPDFNVDASLPSVDVDIHGPKIKSPKVDVPDIDIDIKAPKLKGPSVDIKAPSVDLKGPELDLESPEVKGGVKGFFKGIGGKIKAPDVSLPDVNLKGPDFNLPSFKGPEFNLPKFKGPKIEGPDFNVDASLPSVDVDIHGPKIKSPKVDVPDIDIDIKAPKLKGPSVNFKKPNLDLEYNLLNVDINEINGGVKGFFKGIGGRINTPDVNFASDYILPHTELNLSGISNADIEVNTPNFSYSLNDPKDIVDTHLFYGLDLPMTIVNSNFNWSSNIDPQSNENRTLQKSFFESQTIPSNNFFSFGNYNIINNNENPQIEFELMKAKLRKDPLSVSTNVNISSGETSRFAESKAFKPKLTSASSFSNIDTKKVSSKSDKAPAPRSESAEPSSRLKIDYSTPRKCFLKTRPDFDGLGIHIACDKKTRRSPYIYNIESNSPGSKAGLRKNDFILEVNDEDAVNIEFNTLIQKIQDYIKENNLNLTVGNDKAYKKWVKSRSSSVGRKSKDDNKSKISKK